MKYFITIGTLLAAALWLSFRSPSPNSSPSKNEAQHVQEGLSSVELIPHEKTPDLVRNSPQLSEDSSEPSAQIIQVDPSDLRPDPYAQSAAAQSYVKLGEVELTSSPARIKLEFKKPLKNYVTIVFVGAEGRSKLEDVQMHLAEGRVIQAPALQGPYFMNDWHRFEESKVPISSITFSGQSLDSTKSRLSVLSQLPFN